ncbi:MAG: DeoR/GlpR family DNA-binding transcription regulator [Ignavibacteriaceae bacterium]|nr:DeoR/GlpR family DNA-binding transcription regulator [Ignavibacteriaceae bacterium]
MKIGNEHKIFQEERIRGIMEILEKENRVLITDLCKTFDTTSVTIRKDLNLMENQGLLKRTHGGAILFKPLFHGLALNEKEKLHAEEKERIANEAVKMISVGDVVILDSGSTTTQLAKRLKDLKGIKVITNAVNIALEFANSEIEVVLTGGMLQKNSSTLIGPLAEDVLRKISADKLFHGVDGIDYEIGLTTPDITEANTSRVMMHQASENILLVDSSKFGRRSLGVICRVKEINKIITTKKMDKLEIKKLSDLGVEVIIV